MNENIVGALLVIGMTIFVLWRIAIIWQNRQRVVQPALTEADILPEPFALEEGEWIMLNTDYVSVQEFVMWFESNTDSSCSAEQLMKDLRDESVYRGEIAQRYRPHFKGVLPTLNGKPIVRYRINGGRHQLFGYYSSSLNIFSTWIRGREW